MFYYLSIGSNIKPAEKINEAIKALQSLTKHLIVLPRIHTLPVDIESKLTFVNSAAIIKYEGTNNQLKEELNRIEIWLGRDKKKINSSVSDREIDIDIIGYADNAKQWDIISSHPSSYVSSVLDPNAVFAILAPPYLSEGSTTIYFERLTGNEWVVDQVLHPFNERHEPTFPAQWRL